MSTATITRGHAARLVIDDRRRATRAARMEDAEHLLSFGVDPEEAARRAGWPSAAAAARSTYRAGNLTLARPFGRAAKALRMSTA